METLKELKLKKVTSQELATTYKLSSNTDFNRLKLQLGDIELHKQSVIQDVNELKSQFKLLEESLMKKYGDNSVVNIKTGEITEKENG